MSLPATFVREWRSGSWDSQRRVLVLLCVGVLLAGLVSWTDYQKLPATTYFVWLLLGMLTLRFEALLPLTGFVLVVGLGAMVRAGPLTSSRAAVAATLLASAALILYQSSRQRSGLPGPLSEALLAELKARLQAQGTVPALPAGWTAQSAMIASHGADYAGDFLVAALSDDERRLDMVLVDVCGKGVAAGPQALHFAGALDGLIGALPPQELMRAANRFLLRQRSEESFATAVHVLVDLADGCWTVTSAGHPPALRYDAAAATWRLDGARGTALGVVAEPELVSSSGTLAPGEALMFYTDGVVESRDSDLDEGIGWLQRTAREAVARGFAGAAQRVLDQVSRGDDDRAVLILHRAT
ncbi:PP2C family protein-serine/threonine phosphatase [Nocardioides marmotae]|uniref:PP2C family protein-serine/threonine phosphatase n=1 Tax=Nocardioides marmotae TaxID=2663857 RepID=UPI0012B674FD|nr:PP2C family protein-serine/threonine phosphatase [Nocardioides marmotae]MBC9731669.1 serine/threonine-protein phosphatase [Nocardioides marmotae]MTB82791.1 SpoIIE family protein phosphatase [Nocardioides marmotae]